MNNRSTRFLVALLAATALAACVPQASTAVSLPGNLPTPALFDCADTALRDLHRQDEQWNPRVTRRDVSSGTFETGNFDESNVMGYRVRLVRPSAETHASLTVRAAGPYFTDLGADRAVSGYRTALASCLGQGVATH